MNKEIIKKILHDHEKESTCGIYDFVHREDYEEVADKILSYSCKLENKEKTPTRNINKKQ